MCKPWGVLCPAILSELELEVRRCAILVTSRHRGGGGAGRSAFRVALQPHVVVGLTRSMYLEVGVVCLEVVLLVLVGRCAAEVGEQSSVCGTE